MIPIPSDPLHNLTVIDHLHKWMKFEDDKADDYAKQGGEERATADKHLARADTYDELAVAARARADRWRRHIAFEQAGDETPAVHLVERELQETGPLPDLPDEVAS